MRVAARYGLHMLHRPQHHLKQSPHPSSMTMTPGPVERITRHRPERPNTSAWFNPTLPPYAGLGREGPDHAAADLSRSGDLVLVDPVQAVAQALGDRGATNVRLVAVDLHSHDVGQG